MESHQDLNISQLYEHEARDLAEKAFVDVNTFRLPNTSKFDLPLQMLPTSLMDEQGNIHDVDLAFKVHDMALNNLLKSFKSQIVKPPRHFIEKGREVKCWTIDSYLPHGRAYVIQEKTENDLPRAWLSTNLPKEFAPKIPGRLQRTAKKIGQVVRRAINNNPGHNRIWR